MRFLKKLIIDIPAEYKEPFDLEISRIQAFRAKIVALAFTVIQLFVIVFFVLKKYGRLSGYPNNVYLALYFLYFVGMLIYFFLFRSFEKNVEKNQKKILVTGTTFTYFALQWCSIISILDQLSSGQVIVYIAAIISVAFATLLKPLILLFLYSLVQLLFIIFLPYFQKSQDMIFSNLVNTTTIIVIAWTVASMLYKSKKNDFINKLIIQQKNNEMHVLNEKLVKTNEELEKLSFTDSLTGLYNRRKFNELLRNQWKICRRFSVPVSIIMIDIDYFKQFNDLYGHIAGDNCIVTIANTLKRMTKRPTDCLARYGGEEFIIAVSHLDSKEAYLFTESLRNAIEELRIPHKKSDTADHVTISLGVSTVVPDSRNSIGMLTHSADCALYEAKNGKRNTTIMIECNPSPC